MNANLAKLNEGFQFRLELFTSSMQRSAPEFAYSKKQALFRKRELKAAGYNVTVFAITADGGLTH